MGGTYIDDNENPVILTTEIDKTKLIKQIAGSDKVIVKKCSYSYQELSDLKDEILVRLKEQPEVADKIEVSTFGAHISMNCMEVSIIHCTPEKIELFKSQISDSPMLKFTSDSGYVEIRGNHQETKKTSLKSVNVKSSRKYELFSGNVCLWGERVSYNIISSCYKLCIWVYYIRAYG